MLHYNRNQEAAEKAVKDIQGLGVKAIAVQADATSQDFGDKIVEATLKAFPNRKIDILVNNAGDARFSASLTEFSIEDFDSMVYANVRGPLLLLKAALPHIATPGGRVISIGSISGRLGSKFAGIYSATKGALNAINAAWAEELGEKGITANVVAAGPIDTDMAPPEDHPLVQKFRAIQHVKRNGTAKEIAEVVAFIASPGSSFISGQVIAVDGGLTHA